MAGFWIHPNGKPENSGSGELPEVITWGMIQGKPTEFKPTKHEHEMEEIINLEETISEIYVMINDKVSKETGKQLSEENFTTALKEKLENMENGSTGIISVNGKEGEHIQITKEDLGLGNVLNITQVSQDEFNALAKKVEDLSVEGRTVSSVNGMTGEVVITKETLNLDKVLNVTQASKEEFDSHVDNQDIHVTTEDKAVWSTKESIEGAQQKADKALSDSKLYTDEEIAKIPEVDISHLATKVELENKVDVLNMEMDIRPSVKFGTNELEKVLEASKNSPLNEANLKNIVIVSNREDLKNINPHQGLIAIISSDE